MLDTANTPDDYTRVKQAIEFMSAHWQAHLPMDEIAAHINLSPATFTALFKRWAGLTPKAFQQALTLDHARQLLQGEASVLDASLELGLSGPSRLHDLFVAHEALSPGEYRSGGAGMVMDYGYHPSPFGEALVVANERGMAGLGFVDDGQRKNALEDMQKRWPNAQLRRNDSATGAYAQRVFEMQRWQSGQPLRVVLIGTDFEVRVWETLLKIPMGKATTYGTLANHIGKPTAARAVGAAIGKNPISFVVPCHRVLGKTGALTGYHWGLTRKQAMLGWEAGQVTR